MYTMEEFEKMVDKALANYKEIKDIDMAWSSEYEVRLTFSDLSNSVLQFDGKTDKCVITGNPKGAEFAEEIRKFMK